MLKESGKVMIHPLLPRHNSNEEVCMAMSLLPCECRGEQDVPAFHLYLEPCPVLVRPAAFSTVRPCMWLAELVSVAVRLRVAGMRKEYL